MSSKTWKKAGRLLQIAALDRTTRCTRLSVVFRWELLSVSTLSKHHCIQRN